MQMVEKLKEVGADVIFTVYPDVMHHSWTAVYGDIEVYQWLLECKRKIKGDEKAVPEGNKVSVL